MHQLPGRQQSERLVLGNGARQCHVLGGGRPVRTSAILPKLYRHGEWLGQRLSVAYANGYSHCDCYGYGNCDFHTYPGGISDTFTK